MNWMKYDQRISERNFLKLKFKGSYIYSSFENKKKILSKKEKKEFISLSKEYMKIYDKIKNEI